MTTLEIELDTTVLEHEWEYTCIRDFIVENLQKVFNMPYVACLCSSYGWKGEPANGGSAEDFKPMKVLVDGFNRRRRTIYEFSYVEGDGE